MDYFVLKQDSRYTDVPVLQGVSQQLDRRKGQPLQAQDAPDLLNIWVKATMDTYFLDILDRQLYVISDRLKSLLHLYEPNAVFKSLMLLDPVGKRQQLYFLPFFEEVAALSQQSVWNQDQSVIRTLIVREEALKGKKIVRIQESPEPLLIVRLDVAESILRRGFVGIQLHSVQLD